MSELPALLRAADPCALASRVESLPVLPLPKGTAAAAVPLPPADDTTDDAPDTHRHVQWVHHAVPEATTPSSPALLQALLRDYAVLTSAYLLEGKTKGGAPRTRVPANIAIPFALLCTALEQPLIMEYSSYCLGNACVAPRHSKAASVAAADVEADSGAAAAAETTAADVTAEQREADAQAEEAEEAEEEHSHMRWYSRVADYVRSSLSPAAGGAAGHRGHGHGDGHGDGHSRSQAYGAAGSSSEETPNPNPGWHKRAASQPDSGVESTRTGGVMLGRPEMGVRDDTSVLSDTPQATSSSTTGGSGGQQEQQQQKHKKHKWSRYDGWEWQQLQLIRSFDGGPEEATFVLIHSEIERHGAELLRAVGAVAAAVGVPVDVDASGARNELGHAYADAAWTPVLTVKAVDPEALRKALWQLKGCCERLVVSQLKMLNASDPRNYERFVRPWIFGWKGNADFPTGVVYEGLRVPSGGAGVGGSGGAGGGDGDGEESGVRTGVRTDVRTGVRTFLRGETGAQSSLIPTLDIVLGITHRMDSLRAMLQEMEAYRPHPHRVFLRALRTAFWGPAAEAAPPVPPAPYKPGARDYTGYRYEQQASTPITASFAAFVGQAAGAAAAVGIGGKADASSQTGPHDHDRHQQEQREQREELHPGRHMDIGTPATPFVQGSLTPAPLGVREDGSVDEAPHRLRSYVRTCRDPELITLYNSVIATVWSFRAIHVTFADLYIARFTSKTTATGGTPYRAYLRKHRDESDAAQLREGGAGCMISIPLPSPEEYAADLAAVLEPGTVNGIPGHLLKRHASLLARYGPLFSLEGSASLQRKCFPSEAASASTATAFKAHAAASAGGAGGGGGGCCGCRA